MIIKKRIILDDEDQNLITQMQDLVTQVYNELDGSDRPIVLNELQEALANFAYYYGSDEYRDGCV